MPQFWHGGQLPTKHTLERVGIQILFRSDLSATNHKLKYELKETFSLSELLASFMGLPPHLDLSLF